MDIKKISTSKFYLFLFTTVFFIGLMVLSPSFYLAFQDDDWRGVVLPKTDYADGRLFTPYGIQLWLCGFLYDLFGFNFHYYYILSFVLRFLVSTGVATIVLKLTKERGTSILSGLLTIVAFSGLQTTYETASTNVYIAILGYIVFLWAFFVRNHKISISKLIILASSLLFASLASPVRTYPIYAWVFIVDAIYLLVNLDRERIRLFIIRQAVILGIFFFLYQIGLFGWFSLDLPESNKVSSISRFMSESSSFLSNLNFDIFANLFKGIGNIIFPSIFDKTGGITLIVGILYILSLFVVIYFLIKRKTENLFRIFSFLLWPVILYSCYFVVILGGYPDISKGTVMIESFRRYQLPSYIGLVIGLSLILSYLNNSKSKYKKIFFYAFIILISLQAYATYSFLSELLKKRDGFFMADIWNQIYQSVPISDFNKDKMNVFYFETDKNPRSIYTIDDGFIPHMSALYKIPAGLPAKSPSEITNFSKLLKHTLSFEELVQIVQKGLPNDQKPVEWDRIFAFRVEGNKLVNIKEETKRKIEQIN